ncbi:MAG TPA: amidohydrolase family protein [Cyclobacteriaceae bacterium]|nr:amidohydrolase family protein [Cyclobacteriaceae bacterium]
MTPFYKRSFLKIAAAGVLSLFSSSLLAQSDPTGERRVTGTFAITNATVVSSPGSVSKATIIIKNGLIDIVGNNPTIPLDAQILQGDSLFVYAGFIDVASHAGVSAPSIPERPSNFDPSNPAPVHAGITPQHDVLNYFDASQEELTKWRRAGITTLHLLPKGEGMLPGQTAVVLNGHKSVSNILPASSSLYARFQTVRGLSPGTTLGIMAKWRELYQNAELSAQHQSLFTSNKGVARAEKDPILEAFFPVINKQAPVIFEVGNELDIRRVLNLQKEKGFKLILSGVNEGSSLIPLLKSPNTQVVLSLDLPEDKAAKKELKDASEEAKNNLERVQAAYQERLALASNFEKEGIPFSFGSGNSKSEDFLKNVRLLVQHGLSEQAALAALTTNPAKALGLDKMLGSIEKGKLANLVLTTDSLFKKDAEVRYVFVDGYLFEYETDGKSKAEKSEGKNVAGNWNYEAVTPAGSSSGILTIAKDGDNYSGSISFDDPEGSGQKSSDLSAIKISDNSLEFQFNVDVKGMSILVTVSGEVSGNEYEGKMSIPDFGSFPFTAKKSPESNQ